MLGELPLVAWTIRAALESGCCTDVLVSTDDETIAGVARQYGASVPWLRPAELASDTALSVEVALHALELYEETNGSVDGLLLLQATSPFRSSDSICRAVALFAEEAARYSVVSMSPAGTHPAWCFRRTGDGIEPFLGWEKIGSRSQDLEPALVPNGAIYLISPIKLRQEKKFIFANTIPFVLSEKRESIDIDTETDWIEAVQKLTVVSG